MPVNIGSQPDHGFDHPLGLLGDCHRRIERFLAVQIEVAQGVRGGALDERQRDAMGKALRYFANAAPWHTADEEQSLFPRMRQSDEPAVQDALARMQRLEADHREADARHAEVDRLVRRWLDEEVLGGEDVQRLLAQLAALRATYREHIRFEDEVLFPLAERVLCSQQVQAMGREMAERRGVDAGLPPRRCRHGRTHPAPADAAQADESSAF